MLLDVAVRDLADVIPVIAAVGYDAGTAVPLADPGDDTGRQILDLRPGIVVIELTRHSPARALEQRGDGVA